MDVRNIIENCIINGKPHFDIVRIGEMKKIVEYAYKRMKGMDNIPFPYKNFMIDMEMVMENDDPYIIEINMAKKAIEQTFHIWW